MKCADGRVKCRKLTLQTIAPEHEHRHFSLLMLTSPLVMISVSVAAERRKHGNWYLSNKSGEFSMVP